MSHQNMQLSATSSDVYIDFDDEQPNNTGVYEQHLKVGSLQRESGECKEIHEYLKGQETRYSIREVGSTQKDIMLINNSEDTYTECENDD